MQTTSKIAYQKRQISGQNKADKTNVLRAIKKLKAGSKEDIANYLGWSQEKVHKRISELKNEGQVKETNFKKLASTGHLQMIWAWQGVKEIKLAV